MDAVVVRCQSENNRTKSFEKHPVSKDNYHVIRPETELLFLIFNNKIF